MNLSDAKTEPLESRYIAVEEIRPAVEYAGRGQFDSNLWWQGAVVVPCFLLVEKGRVEAHTAWGKFVAPAGSLICFRPTTKRVWGVIAPALVWEMGIRFAPPPQQHLVPWLPDVGPAPLYVTLGDLFDRARQLVELIYAELPRTLLADQLRVRAAVFELLGIMREAARAGGDGKSGGPLAGAARRSTLAEMDDWQRARLRLESDLQRPLTVKKVARDLGVTADYFTRRFRRRFGMSPHTCRTRAKLREALGMLRHDAQGGGGEPVKTVAYRLGFNDPKAFARLFKRHLGLNPSQVTAAGAGADAPATVQRSPVELFPGNTHVLPADRETIAPFAELTILSANAPPPFTSRSIIYRRPR